MNPRTLVVGLLAAAALCFRAAAETMSVQVQDGVLRATASPFGKPVASLKYGDRVEVLGANGAWMQVRGQGGATGWLHQNSLSRKPLAAGTGQTQAAAGATAGEVALAGKGFNSQLEKDLRGKDQTLDFRTIEQMETWGVSESESLNFLRDGGVKPQGGQP